MWVRWTHWLNLPVLTIMIWSGVLIYWANRAYWPGLPDSFYAFFGFDHRLAEGLSYHFTFMWLFAFNGVIYVVASLLTGEWRDLAPTWRTPREAWQVVLHDLGLSKRPLPAAKFNGAQRLAYTGVILMGALSVLTGLAIYKPIQLSLLKELFGGYASARLIHYILTIGYVLFFVVHLLQVIRAGWSNFHAMIAGYEEVSREHESQ